MARQKATAASMQGKKESILIRPGLLSVSGSEHHCREFHSFFFSNLKKSLVMWCFVCLYTVPTESRRRDEIPGT